MGFVIKKIVVHAEPTRVKGGDTHYNMVREKWDVRNLLEVRILFNLIFFAFLTAYDLIIKYKQKKKSIYAAKRYFHASIATKIFVWLIYLRI